LILQRLKQLEHWLAERLPEQPFSLAPASADASFRRYFRATFADGHTLIAMDAPPAHEDCVPFIRVAELFGAAGVHVPKVLEQDLALGFLLLSDLGSTTYLSALDDSNADRLYRDAAAALVKIQQASRPGILPDYDEALLIREMRLFPDWYVARHLGLTLTEAERTVMEDTFALLNRTILAQGQVYVHRDYHSRNLMVCEDNPGILDFQDAVYGAVTYDLVSLLRDAYIRWEEERALDWAVRYWEKARAARLPVPPDFSAFYRDFEWMGAQRHIKVLGIFARLCYRDGKQDYLKDMPLVMEYLRHTCERYFALHPFLKLLDALEKRQTQIAGTASR
jgi:aminoglycoside/choline kinase family phosphotransferase